MRVVITGASGRIGRHIFAQLAATHQLLGIDQLASPTAQVVASINDRSALRRAFAGADAVVHCAALHAPHVGVESDARFRQVNVDGTRAVLEEAAAAAVKRLVFTSSTAVYGAGAAGTSGARWIDDQTSPQPQTIYHHSKLQAESILREAACAGGPSVRVLRISRCFPEPARIMATYRLHRAIDARDAAVAHRLALEHQGTEFDCWIVSAATPFMAADCEALQVNAAAVIRHRVPRLAAAFDARGWALPGSIDRIYDSARAQQMLRWTPQFGFEAVLAQADQGTDEVLRETPH